MSYCEVTNFLEVSSDRWAEFDNLWAKFSWENDDEFWSKVEYFEDKDCNKPVDTSKVLKIFADTLGARYCWRCQAKVNYNEKSK